MNKVLMTNIVNPTKTNRTDAYELSINSWKRWCDGNDVELFVLTEPIADMNVMSPIYFRHFWYDLLEVTPLEQVCLVDADTIIHPECPNFFNLTEHKFSAVHNDGDYDWVIRSIENYQYEFSEKFTKKFDLWKYINCGFMVTNTTCIQIHKALTDFYMNNITKVQQTQQKYGVGTDQPLMNLFLNELSIDINLLSSKFNIQDLTRKNILDDRMLFTQIPGIYHFNAIPGGKLESDLWIKKTHKHLFGIK